MKTTQVVLESGTYEVREPTVGVLFPIIDLMEKSPKDFQMALVKKSIFVNGQPIGESVNNLGLGEYIKLMQAVLEVTGLSGDTAGKPLATTNLASTV